MKIRKRYAMFTDNMECIVSAFRKTVRAHTKGEARSIFKKIIGVKKGRLPIGYIVSEVKV